MRLRSAVLYLARARPVSDAKCDFFAQDASRDRGMASRCRFVFALRWASFSTRHHFGESARA